MLDHRLDVAVGDQALVEPRLRLEPFRIVPLDQPVRAIEDRLAGAVVALEHDHARALERVEEAEQVLDLGAAEAVDALVVVADDGQVAPVADEQLHELELHVVRVLELVDEHEPVAVLQLAPQVRPLAQQAQGEPDLGAEVDAAVFEHELEVCGVSGCLFDLCGRAVPLRGVVAGLGRKARGEGRVSLGRDVLVACAVEDPDQGAQVRVRRAERAVARKRQLEDTLAQEHENLGRVLDPELRGEPQFDRVLAHEPVAEAVERADGGAHESVGHEHVDA